MTTQYPPETTNGVVTSFIALPTPFTAGASCGGIYRQNGFSLVAYDPGYGLEIDPTVLCAPPAVTTWWEQGKIGHANTPGHTAISLGPMVCPNSWKTVVTSVRSQSSTLAMCCPPDYYLTNAREGSIAGDCRSDVTPGMTMIYAATGNGATTSWSTITSIVSASSYVGAIAVVGWNIQQTSSSSPTLLSSPTLAGSSLATPTSATDSAATSSPGASSQDGSTQAGAPVQPDASTEPGSSSRGLSVAGAVGVGIGVTLGAIGIVALLVVFCLKRRRSRNNDSANKQQTADDAPADTAVHGPNMKPWEQAYWPGTNVEPLTREELEAPSSRPPVELDGGAV